MQWLVVFDNGTHRAHVYVNAPERASAIDKARGWVAAPAGRVLACVARGSSQGGESDSPAALVKRQRSRLARIGEKGNGT